MSIFTGEADVANTQSANLNHRENNQARKVVEQHRALERLRTDRIHCFVAIANVLPSIPYIFQAFWVYILILSKHPWENGWQVCQLDTLQA